MADDWDYFIIFADANGFNERVHDHSRPRFATGRIENHQLFESTALSAESLAKEISRRIGEIERKYHVQCYDVYAEGHDSIESIRHDYPELAAMLVVEMCSAIERLTTLGEPDVDAISAAVGIPLTRTNPDASPTDPMRYFEGTFEDGPFRAVDLRMNIKTGLVFLVLRVRKDCVVHQDETAPHIDGTLRRGIVNPDIPPEGQVAYYYEKAGLRLAFSFTASSRTFTSISIDWPKRTPRPEPDFR